MSEWKEIARPGDVSVWDPAEGEEVVGTLTKITNDVGINKSTIYEVTTEEDEIVGIWETAVLRSKLDQVPVGSGVKIVYLGKRKSKKGPGSYKDFQVFSKPTTSSEAGDVFGE